jgi:prepilin-type N-terminal cleavage/methylation domain-containing protein
MNGLARIIQTPKLFSDQPAAQSSVRSALSGVNALGKDPAPLGAMPFGDSTSTAETRKTLASAIPTGLCPTAQGCSPREINCSRGPSVLKVPIPPGEERATLGPAAGLSTPTGLRYRATARSQPRWGCWASSTSPKAKWRRGFSLIEMVGVLAVIAILAAIAVPAVVKRVDFAAWSSENASLSAMKDALVQHILRNNNIPSNRAAWAIATCTNLGLLSANITTNSRNYGRAFLIDTSGWLATALASGDWNQRPGGETMAPTNCRLMIVSTIAGPQLPDSLLLSSKPSIATFNGIWYYTNFSGWTGNANDLVVQRINLEPLFHRLILVNGAGGPGYFSINTKNPTAVPPGASGTNTYYLDGTVLGLYDTNITLLVREVIRSDMSRVFEYVLWRDQINVGTTNSPPASAGLVSLAATFFNFTNAPPNAPPGATPQGVLGSLTSYMNGYSAWAAMSPCFYYPSSTNSSYSNGNFAPYNAINGALGSSGVVP